MHERSDVRPRELFKFMLDGADAIRNIPESVRPFRDPSLKR